jgi:hypothetical protein
MHENASEFFAFLTNSYLAEPTPENSQRLWRAVFALDGLYFLLREVGGEPVPAIALQDGEPHLLVWTDLESLRGYVHEREPDLQASEHYLYVPMQQVLDHIFRYCEFGVTGVRFNAPLGWSVPFERLRRVVEQLGMG